MMKVYLQLNLEGEPLRYFCEWPPNLMDELVEVLAAKDVFEDGAEHPVAGWVFTCGPEGTGAKIIIGE